MRSDRLLELTLLDANMAFRAYAKANNMMGVLLVAAVLSTLVLAIIWVISPQRFDYPSLPIPLCLYGCSIYNMIERKLSCKRLSSALFKLESSGLTVLKRHSSDVLEACEIPPLEDHDVLSWNYVRPRELWKFAYGR